jgi:hypothetical protein
MNAVPRQIAHLSLSLRAPEPRAVPRRRPAESDPLHRTVLYVGTLVPAVLGFAIMQWFS